MPEMSPEILEHYESGYDERTRLEHGPGRLELARTQEIVRRFLKPPPARVLDVGGGPGVHAAWLAADGYDVELVDPVERHVAEAHADHGIASRVGDARALDADDESYDAVLLLGPCYHLVELEDRLLALSEARRVARRDGLVFVGAVSRFASLFDGVARGFLFDPAFGAIVERDLADGVHRNDGNQEHWFTTAYFHRPEELVDEASRAGLNVLGCFGLEGIAGWIDAAMERWDDEDARSVLLGSARAIESEPSLAGLSAHLLLVAQRTS